MKAKPRGSSRLRHGSVASGLGQWEIMPEIQKVLPKYLQIASHIRDQIVRGDLLPGQEVSSERELAATWKVARPTAGRALEWLRTQGFVESRVGAGTFVRAVPAAPRALERYARGQALGTMYAAGESVEFLSVGTIPAPQHVMEALQLPEGSTAIRRARRLSSHDGPIELSTSWFDGRLAETCPGLLVGERLLGGTGAYIGEQTGRIPTIGQDRVAARLATADECELLALAAPAAVLTYWMTVLDDRDQPLQFDEAVYPQLRWAFHQEYPLA